MAYQLTSRIVAFHLKRRHSPIKASPERNKLRLVDSEYYVIMAHSLHFTTEVSMRDRSVDHCVPQATAKTANGQAVFAYRKNVRMDILILASGWNSRKTGKVYAVGKLRLVIH